MGAALSPLALAAVLVPCAQGTAGPLPLTLLPCAQNLPRCAEESGVEEFQALHSWLLSSPERADDIGAFEVSERGSNLELQSFQLVKELGLTLLASSLDYVAVCQHSDPRCAMLAQHFEGVKALRMQLDARLREMAKDYLPDPGVRSPVLRVGHSLRSDLDGFLRQLPTLQAGLPAAEASARLAQSVGLRGRMLAWHLGMHFWVRHLEVPGRGAPVLILHEEYTSFKDMVSSVVGMMVRNGQPQLVMMEVGVPAQEWLAPSLVRSVAGLQYVGIMLEPEDDASAQAQMAAYEQLKAEAQAPEIANRIALHYASAQRAAAAFPDRGAMSCHGPARDVLWEALPLRRECVFQGPGSDHYKMPQSNFPPCWPSPLSQQKAMAARRAADVVLPSESASGVGSWTAVNEVAQQVPASSSAQPSGVDQTAQPAQGEEPGHTVWVTDSDENVPPQDFKGFDGAPQQASPSMPVPQWGTAPATQAAKNLLDNQIPKSSKLAKQKARAKEKGHRGVRWGQMPAQSAFSPQNFQLPPFVQQLGSGQDERSVLIVDNRDMRSPSSGYHMNIFYVRAMDGYKFILVGSMTCYGSVPYARWDADTGAVLNHAAFQPFRWPLMREDSSVWVDVKIKIEGQLLLHLEMRGYRSEQDMTVQLNYINDGLITSLREELFIPAVVVTIFQGWRVIAVSFEVGGRIYACSEKGVVVALDFPLCHFEVRMTALSSADSVGVDADRLEFRFRSAGDSVDVTCSQITVPPTWLILSRVSGPTLIQNARWCRDRHARVEGPDQTMQMSQLAGIHAHWTAATEALTVADTGPRVGAVAVDTHQNNLHLTCEAPLFQAQKVIVPAEAIALQFHDPESEERALVVPPVMDGPMAIPAAQAPGSLRALAGPAAAPLQAAPPVEAVISVTEAGHAPKAAAPGDKTVHVHRRSLEARQSESLADAAVTPQAFLDQVGLVKHVVSGDALSHSFGGPQIESEHRETAIHGSPFSNLAFVAAMEVGSAHEFVSKVGDWAPQLDESIRDDLLSSTFMLEQFWSLACSVEKAFFESTANQLGFGLCEAPAPPISAVSAKARRAGAIKALSGKTVNPPRKFLKTSPEPQSATPLLDQDNAARWKWAARLEEIERKAGTFSKLLLDTSNEKGLSHAEVARLRQLVLSSGAPRTMATHVTNWERFAEWAEAEVISKRARTLKEAVPIPTAVVRAMELLVVDEGEPEATRLFTWWWLCMVFASLRFDDAMHVRPDELILNEESMFGVAWQTKVERKRRGTKFVVPHVGFSGSDWLRAGWQLLQNEHFALARDYWMRDLNSREAFRNGPAQYQRSVQWLRFFGRYALNHYHQGEEVEFKELAAVVNTLTAHSARVTMLDAAVHAGRSTEEIGLQANWKNPGPLVLKYTRNRSAIPAKMVQQLVKDMLTQEHPVEVSDDTELDAVDQSALDQFQFYIKTNCSAAAYDCRYHCAALGEEEALACGRLKLVDCTHVGSCLPDIAMLCKHCARVRPEIAESFAQSA
ncbi:unnamed protein product [Cladocopium goreaui]|uniref:Peptidase C45 hydrolase domain-containing protein n=1 Tax=Cladocopium goreaui TaxID=2562237 RepID=A0A9P1CW52_9DINO|nr:unnamed protein product [Cladocopium goreaui]